MISRRKWALAAAVPVALGLLAWASYKTTAGRWTGGFPAGQIRLHVVDQQGRPVPGATLRLFHAADHKPAGSYPLAEHAASRPLVADDNGVIVAHQIHSGVQFGGFRWRLFWLVPMGQTKGPQFDCEFRGPGVSHEITKMGVDELFDFPGQTRESAPKTPYSFEGQKVDFPVWTKTVVLRKG